MTGHVGSTGSCGSFNGRKVLPLGDNTPFLIDMNARIGGGYPFSHVAGANLPAALIAWVKGEKHRKEWLEIQPNVLAVKGLQMYLVGE